MSDDLCEDVRHDSQMLLQFLDSELSRETVPDSAKLLKFRRMLEGYYLTIELFEEVKMLLAERGLFMPGGGLVGATIIAAERSTKNNDCARDLEMHQTKKGNPWHFGLGANIGPDAEVGLVRSLQATAAKESDIAHAHLLLHDEEVRVHLYSGYVGINKREEVTQAQVTIREELEWDLANKRGKIKKDCRTPAEGVGQSGAAHESADPSPC